MNWVNQIISAVEAGGKAPWVVFISCAILLILEQFSPDLFVGIPEWSFPIIRIVAIFSLVLSIANLIRPIKQRTISWWQNFCAPIKRRSIRTRLLNIDIWEVLILCRAIAQQDRTIMLKPDLAQAINLLDLGIIEQGYFGVISGDGTINFNVPMEVWRIMLSMNEFTDFNYRVLLRAIDGGIEDEALILQCLPQSHPAVIAQTKQHAA